MGKQIPGGFFQSMGVKSDWDQKVERRTANIGFISRLNAFREPTEFEKAKALATEINSWQASKGTLGGWRTSAEYSIPIGHQVKNNEKWDNRINMAKEAYVNTPMDKTGALRALGIDVDAYKPKPFTQKLIEQIKIYAPQVIAVSTLLLGIYLILKGMK